MDRRNFLRSLVGAAATTVVAPKVIYVLPPMGGWQQTGHVHTFKDLIVVDASWRLCTEVSLVDALRKVDPHVGVVFNCHRHSVEIASRLPGEAFKPALWWNLAVGVMAEHNGERLPNDYGLKEAING